MRVASEIANCSITPVPKETGKRRCVKVSTSRHHPLPHLLVTPPHSDPISATPIPHSWPSLSPPCIPTGNIPAIKASLCFSHLNHPQPLLSVFFKLLHFGLSGIPLRGTPSRSNPRAKTKKGTATCEEPCLLLAVAEVGVGVGVLARGLVRVLLLLAVRLAPALPLDHVRHAALPHRRRLRHVVLHAARYP